MNTLFARKEPTNDEVLLARHPTVKKHDTVLYYDHLATRPAARIPWHYSESTPQKRDHFVVHNCLRYLLAWLPPHIPQGGPMDLTPEALICEGETLAIHLDGKSFFATRADSRSHPWELYRPTNMEERYYGSKGLIGTYASFERLAHAVKERVGELDGFVLHMGPICLLICILNPDGTCTYKEPEPA